MKRVSLLLTVLALILFQAADATASGSRTATTSYFVSIHCGSCEAKLTEHLRFERGVRSISIEVSKKKVEITYNPRRTDAERLGRAIEKLGYEVQVYPVDGDIDVTMTEGGCCSSRHGGAHNCAGKKEGTHTCSGQKEGASGCCSSKKEGAHTCSAKKEGASGCCSSKKEGAHTCSGKKEGASGCCSSKKTTPEGNTGTDTGAAHQHRGSCNHGSR